MMGPARAQSPASDAARGAVASLLRIEPAQLKELRLFRFTRASTFSGALVGRYEDRGFPVLALYHHCSFGDCLSLVSVGAAADRIELAQLIDLDAPSTTLEQLTSLGLGFGVARTFVEPPAAARWPALVVLSERKRDDEQEIELALISLREPNPTRLWSITTLRRQLKDYPPPPAGPPPTAPLGSRVNAVTFEHRGAEHTIVVRDSLIEGHDNPCLPPTPGETRLRLDGDSYKQVSVRPSTICH